MTDAVETEGVTDAPGGPGGPEGATRDEDVCATGGTGRGCALGPMEGGDVWAVPTSQDIEVRG